MNLRVGGVCWFDLDSERIFIEHMSIVASRIVEAWGVY